MILHLLFFSKNTRRRTGGYSRYPGVYQEIVFKNENENVSVRPCLDPPPLLSCLPAACGAHESRG